MHGVEFSVLLHRALQARVRELKDAAASEGGFNDPLVVHHARVACRRLGTVLGLLDAAAYPHLKGHTKALHDFAKRLGALRDLDVQLAAMERLHASASQPLQQAALEYVLERLAQRRQQRLDALNHTAPTFSRLLQVKSLPNPFDGLPLALAAWHHLQPCISAALAPLGSRRQQEDIQALHESRIQVKRLRDTMEALAPAFPTEPVGFLMELRAMQTALGEHHDQAALATLLQKRLEHLRSAGRPALAASLAEVLDSVVAARQQAFELFRALEGPWDEGEFSARVQALLGASAA